MIFKILIASIMQMTLAVPLQMPFRMQETNQQQMLLQQLQGMTQLQIPFQGAQQMSLAGMQHVPFLQPMQGTIQQHRLALKEQMFALQQFQALQRMNLVPSFQNMNSPPILVLFPNNEPDVRNTDFNVNSLKYQKPEEIGDDDSDVIDAEITKETNVRRNPMRAVLLMPNTRSFIGDFISGIPFLPIEINVPDSISWIYNGIAGIIAGIGQNFMPPATNGETPTPDEEINTKSIWNKIKQKQQMPIVVIPLGQTL